MGKLMFENSIVGNYHQIIENFKKNEPEINLNSLYKLLSNFVISLKNSIENPDEKNISWDYPFIQLEYPIEIDANGSEIIFLKEKEYLVEKALEKDYIEIFRTITKDITLTHEKSKIRHQLPDSILEKVKKASPKQQSEIITQYLNIEPIIISPISDKPSLFINFYPVVIDKENNKKFYPVIIGLKCDKFKPGRWKEDTKEKFWRDILKLVSDGESKINLTFDFGNEIENIPLPEPDVKVPNKNKLIKTSLHTELQKFGKKPKHKDNSIFDMVPAPIDEDTKKDIINYQINVVGIDNTHSQNMALFALQKLLHDTNYKGNFEGKTLYKDENSFKFTGYLPFMKFTPAQYLDAYGVNKRQTARGKSEYNSNERAEAFKALRELSDKKYLFYYERKYWKDGKEVLDIIKTVRPLFSIVEGYEAIDISERDEVLSEQADEKLKFIVTEPCPMLVDQIDSYFVLKPANCYQEIRLLVGKTSRHVTLFIDYLRAEVTKREINMRSKAEIDWVIDINYENLAYKLRMESFINTKQVKRIKQTLEKCYKIASQLGYLLDYKTITGQNKEVERLILNPDKFKRVKEIDEEIRMIESKVNLLNSDLNKDNLLKA